VHCLANCNVVIHCPTSHVNLIEVLMFPFLCTYAKPQSRCEQANTISE
jgi:hypothetical protein